MPARQSVDIAVLTALPAEMPVPLRQTPPLPPSPQDRTHRETHRHEPPILVTPYRAGSRNILIASMVTGAGKVAAAAGMAALLQQVHPGAILCGGIAGSLNAELPAGTVTVARTCRYWDRDATAAGLPLGVVEPAGEEVFALPAGEDLAKLMDAPAVRIATGDSVVTAKLLETLPPAWRNCLVQDSDLVDMESAAWVETAGGLGYDLAVCRTVFDMILTGERGLSFREGCRLAAEALQRAIPLVLSPPER